MTGASVLDVSGLSVDFRTDGAWHAAVRKLSFSIAARETLAIVGESGSGKSATALALMQLLPRGNSRATGRAMLSGRDLLGLDETAMASVRGNEIGMVFQEPMTSLNPVLTVGEQIGESLRIHRGLHGAAVDAEVVRQLERVRIPAARARLDEYPHRLSGGMRQRVMIAMALACRPTVLIADEPTTALDVTVQAQILELLRSLQVELGMAVVFITHDMGVVAEIADRTLVMWRGEKVEEGDTVDLFARAAHPYTRSLLGAVPVLGSMRCEPAPKKFVLITPAGARADAAPVAASAPESLPPKALAPMLLEVTALCTRFDVGGRSLGRPARRVHAVEGVSFHLDQGETLALVGESGCGKSTTGRSILRLVEPDSGTVRFDGIDVHALDRPGLVAFRRRAQMIFQDPYASLDPRLPVGRAIAEPIVVHGIARRRDAPARVAELLRQVGLSPDMAGRYPHEFSGGQRQRVCIARALALSPSLIVADEAVSALDVSVKAQVLNLLIDLQHALGLSYLFISHDMAVVERISHRIGVMYLGEIVEIGPRAEVVGNPQHPYTRKLLAAVPVPDPTRRGTRPAVAAEDLPDPTRAHDYESPVRQWRRVSEQHLVQEVS